MLAERVVNNDRKVFKVLQPVTTSSYFVILRKQFTVLGMLFTVLRVQSNRML